MRNEKKKTSFNFNLKGHKIEKKNLHKLKCI